ncbi:uncharacterized protein DNG_09848 [Cephalotrichum gorgonifer]|uniref:C2H2-type domain-containing protein n=1 Tax=Cephalotrichum gorgonifer TaxID=2041049 RepID=A0AAE8SZP0_9PEZI|nr:uncharacterized protein DNG_09848 [Cephalotrichum gorgonifer]
MERPTFRSATVEECDERENGAPGGTALPYIEGDMDGASRMNQDHQQPHACEPRNFPQTFPVQIQPVNQYPAEAYHPLHPSHGEVEKQPPPPQMADPPPPPPPAAPTPPLDPPRPKKSKAKTGSSSRRRNKDRPEYYGVRGATAAVVAPSGAAAPLPTEPVNAGPLPRSSNARMSRRPTTDWYVNRDPPADSPDSMPRRTAASSHPHRARADARDTTPPPQGVPPVSNAFHNDNAAQGHGQQPPTHHQSPIYHQPPTQHQSPAHHQSPAYPQSPTNHQPPTYHQSPSHQQSPIHHSPTPYRHDHSNSWDTADANNRGPEPPQSATDASPYPPYPPTQPNNHGIIVISQREDPPSAAPGRAEEDYFQPPHPPPPPAQGNPHRIFTLTSNANNPPPPPPAQNNPHRIFTLSSNGNRPAAPPNEEFHHSDFQREPPANDERRPPPPTSQRPVPQHDSRFDVQHQMPGRQSARATHAPPAQPRTGYGRARDPPLRDSPPYETPNLHSDFQRLSVQGAPPLGDRRMRQPPSNAKQSQFRSQDVPPLSPSRPNGTITSYPPSDQPVGHSPHGRQQERYPASNDPGRYTPHPQRRHSGDRYPPAQPRRLTETPVPTDSGDWHDPPRQRASKTPYPQQSPHGYSIRGEGNGHQPPSRGQVGYLITPPRNEPSREIWRPGDHPYPDGEEEFASDYHGSTHTWADKHPGGPPTLPEGHPFLDMKDMALGVILKEFRAWQNAGMPGRRGPHPRRPPFACPFAKKDPLRYKDCFSESLPGIPDVKEHISRCHSIPIYCPRCMELFDEEVTRDKHIRYSNCPPAQKWSTPDGVTESQKRQLREDVPARLPVADQWARVFAIVFQPQQKQQREPPQPESPYVDENLHEEVASYRDFLDTRGPSVLSDTLTFGGKATWTLPNEERDLAAFRRLALEEGVRDLVDQWASRGRHEPLRSLYSLASSSSADRQGTPPSMGSFASSDGPPTGLGRNYPPSSPVEAHHHWDPNPRIRDDGWDDPVAGSHRAEHADFPDSPRSKVPMYHGSSRHGPAAYY